MAVSRTLTESVHDSIKVHNVRLVDTEATTNIADIDFGYINGEIIKITFVVISGVLSAGVVYILQNSDNVDILINTTFGGSMSFPSLHTPMATDGAGHYIDNPGVSEVLTMQLVLTGAANKTIDIKIFYR